MKIGARRTPVPYGEILRTLGRQLDARCWGSLRLDARAAHLVLEARPAARWGPTERLVLTPVALVRLLRETRGGRGIDGVATAVPRHPVGLGYGEALRLIGQALDRRGARLVRVIEHPDGLIVQAFPPGAGLTTVLASWPHLKVRHRQALAQRQARAGGSA